MLLRTHLNSTAGFPRTTHCPVRAGRHRLAIAAALIAVTVGSIAWSSFDSPAVFAADIIYVHPAGNDNASGSASSPVRTVSRAVDLADSGDTVQIAHGVYHEQVQVYSEAIRLQAAPGAEVVFDGARIVEGWQSAGNGRWAASWSTNFARASALHTSDQRPEAGWPEQFFFDGAPLTEVARLADLVPGSFFYDRGNRRVLLADNPSGHRIEGSDLNWGIYFNRANGSSVDGITVRRYATTHSNLAAVRAFGDRLDLANLVVEDNAYKGISAIGNDISLTQVTSRRNGHLGVHGHRVNSISIVGSVVTGNNAELFDPFHAAGGIKVTSSRDIEVRDNQVSHNGGPGIWTDLDVTDVVVVGNTVIGNSRSGIEMELSERVVVADNVVVGNGETGVWILESVDAEVWHNAVFDNHRDIWIEDGPRDDVHNVKVFNNTMGGIGSGAPAILTVEDWTGTRRADDMAVSLDHNRYWFPSASTTSSISRWRNGSPSSRSEYSSDIATHRAVTGQGRSAASSNAATNPYIRSRNDYRQPIGAEAGQALSSNVAAVVGLAAGRAFPAGPLDVNAPAPAPATTTTTSVVTTLPVATTTPPTVPATTTAPPTVPTTTTVAGLPDDQETIVVEIQGSRGPIRFIFVRQDGEWVGLDALDE